MELAQLRARLDPDRVDEHRARPPVSLKCVSLTPAAIERQHPLAVETLAQRLLRDERLGAQAGPPHAARPRGRARSPARPRPGAVPRAGGSPTRRTARSRRRRAEARATARAPRAAGPRRRAARSAERRPRHRRPAAARSHARASRSPPRPRLATSDLRNCTTKPCTIFGADTGGASPHRPLISRSADTVDSALSASIARRARGFRAPIATVRSPTRASTGPVRERGAPSCSCPSVRPRSGAVQPSSTGIHPAYTGAQPAGRSVRSVPTGSGRGGQQCGAPLTQLKPAPQPCEPRA